MNTLERQTEHVRYSPTPWGNADSITHYGPGVAFYSTPSHGGFKLSAERLAQVKAKFGPIKLFRDQTEWFEEDCDWAYVALTFPEMFTSDEQEAACQMWDCYLRPRLADDVPANTPHLALDFILADGSRCTSCQLLNAKREAIGNADFINGNLTRYLAVAGVDKQTFLDQCASMLRNSIPQTFQTQLAEAAL